MGNKLFLAVVITLLLAILSGMNAVQPSAPVAVTNKSSPKQKLSFQFFRPAPSQSETVR